MRHLHKGVSFAIGLAVLGASLAACGGGGDPATGAGGQIELTIGTFTEFGYEDLLPEYERLHPNIKITHHKTGEGGPYHQNLITKLAAGSGLEDVVAVEEGHFSDIIDKSGKFNDLTEIGPKDVTADRWLNWKYDAGKDKDGRLIGYGTDIGPLALCYRKDLLAAANLPSDPEGVKAIFSSWDSYFAAGQSYVAKTGKPWFDASSQLYNSMVNQLDVGYFDRGDNLTIESNPGIKAAWDRVTTAIGQGQSAKLVAFGNEWKTGFAQGAFATTVCPSWMLGVVKEDSGAANAGKWAVTDAFPNGGGNWGGSYLTVPKQSRHPKEAAELAAWLTALEQQLKAFQAKGNFPSQTQALTSPTLLSQTEPYFGDVKVGELYAEQARKVTKAQYKGPGDGQIQENVTSPALQAVEQGTAPAQAWQQVVDGAKKIAKQRTKGNRLMVTSTVLEPRQRAPRGEPAKPTLRERLARWDVKVSPYLYIAPFFVVFGIAGLFPLLYTAYVSLFDWEVGDDHPKFLGLKNYVELFGDAQFWNSVVNTLSIFVLSSGPQIVIAVLLAALLNTGLRGPTGWRVGILLPYAASLVAIGIIFANLFGPNYGLVNSIFDFLGLDRFSGRPTGSPATSRSRSW